MQQLVTTKDAVAQEFKISITDATGKEAYPYFCFHLDACLQLYGQTKRRGCKKFAAWTQGREMHRIWTTKINYSPVPKELRTAVLKKD